MINANQTELSYRRTAVEEATPADLVIILYDMLVGDLRQAIVALGSGKIEERSTRLKHALSVLQLLEGSLDTENGGIAAHHLSQFYSHIRRQILIAQFKGDERILQEQIALVLDVREAWRQIDSVSSARPLPVLPVAPSATDCRAVSSPSTEGISWSA
jgi:flagellar secretion chaperone FliS